MLIQTRTEKIPTSIAKKILGINEDTIFKYIRLKKITKSCRASDAPQAPWRHDRNEIEGLKHAGHSQ